MAEKLFVKVPYGHRLINEPFAANQGVKLEQTIETKGGHELEFSGSERNIKIFRHLVAFILGLEACFLRKQADEDDSVTDDDIGVSEF